MEKYVASYAKMRERILTAKHHFHLLHVHRTSTEADIRSARSGLAKVVHPDVNSANDAHLLMSRVNAACTELLNNRETYLRTLSQKPCAACRGRGYTTRQKGFAKTVETVCSTCHGSGVL